MLNILLILALVLLLIGGAILAAAFKIPLVSKYPEPILASAVLPYLAEVPNQRPSPPPSGWG